MRQQRFPSNKTTIVSLSNLEPKVESPNQIGNPVRARSCGFFKGLQLFCLGVLFIAMLFITPLRAQEQTLSPVGYWTGVLKVPAQELHLGLHVGSNQHGDLTGTLDSIDQRAMGLSTRAVSVKGSLFSFEVPSIQGHYEGTITTNGGLIVGNWTQGPATFALTWTRGHSAEPATPQEPTQAQPYHSEEVWVENGKAGVRLAGTFTKPAGQGPFPAVFLIGGSGPHDRNETILGHKPFLILADFLTRRGVSVLRVDDRGVGASTGTFEGATTNDFATDALAAIAFLQGRPDVNHNHIGIVGHSEGAIIAPMVAVQSRAVSFLVLLAGTAVPGEVLLTEQVYRSALAVGQSEQVAQFAANHAAAWMSAFDRAGDAANALEIMQALHENMVSASQLQAELVVYGSPWFRWFADYDPYPTLRKVSCPVLAINGSQDVQVPAGLNTPFMRLALAGNTRSRAEIVDGLNHLFQRSASGSPLDYGSDAETMSPEVLQRVGGWISEQI